MAILKFYPDRVYLFLLLGLVILPLVLVAAGCSSSKNGTENEEKPGDGQGISAESLDLTPPENLAPGSAQVHISIHSTETSAQDRTVWTVEIEEVLGYGSSTPPLGIGTKMKVDATSYLVNSGTQAGEMAAGDQLICLISHSEAPQGSQAPAWSLVNVFEQ